jgi:hypothetical protein
MIIFLYGPDSYRRTRKQKEVLASYMRKYAFAARAVFCAEDPDPWVALRAYAREWSLFGGAKLAIARDLLARASGDDVSVVRAASSDSSLVLLFMEESAPPKAFSFLREPPVAFQEFGVLHGAALRDFIASEARARRVSLARADAAALAAAYSGDSWAIVTELDRMALASELPVRSSVEAKPDFISCIKSLAYGRALGERLASLERLLSNNDPARTFNMLAAFVAGEKKRRMADYDIAVKRGNLDYAAALLDFAIN